MEHQAQGAERKDAQGPVGKGKGAEEAEAAEAEGEEGGEGEREREEEGAEWRKKAQQGTGGGGGGGSEVLDELAQLRGEREGRRGMELGRGEGEEGEAGEGWGFRVLSGGYKFGSGGGLVKDL